MQPRCSNGRKRLCIAATFEPAKILLMRALLQRVTSGAVTIDGAVHGQIAHGLVVLLGVTHEDTTTQADLLARKTATLRIFDDGAGKMNLSVLDVGGGVLVVSQFTLYANVKGARRPDFMAAAKPDVAAPLVDRYVAQLRAAGIERVETGVFGAMMAVTIQNDGPVTIWLDTAEL